MVVLSCSTSVLSPLNLASGPCPSVNKATHSSVKVSRSSGSTSRSFVNSCPRYCSCWNLGFCSKGPGVPYLQMCGIVGSLLTVRARPREL